MIIIFKKRSVLSLLVIILLLFILRKYFSNMNLDVENLIQFVEDSGRYSVFFYILAFALKPLIVIMPSSIFTVAGGTIFGPLKGLLLSMTGFFLSSTLAFYLGRFLGQSFIKKIINKNLETITNVIERYGFRITLLLRLVPVMPFDPVSYAAGVTNINYITYITSTLLGIFPETMCYILLGKGLRDDLNLKFLLPIAAVMLLSLGAAAIVKKKYRIDN